MGIWIGGSVGKTLAYVRMTVAIPALTEIDIKQQSIMLVINDDMTRFNTERPLDLDVFIVSLQTDL